MGTNNERQQTPGVSAGGRPSLFRWRHVLRRLRGRRGTGIRLMRYVLRIPYDAALKFLQHDGWAIASYIALAILTSLFPFLIFVTALAGFFGTKALANEAANLLLQTWPQQVAAPIAHEIHNVLTNARSGALTLGVVLAIYFSSTGVDALRIGLNRAYGAKDNRSWWLLRIESIAYVFIGAFSLLTLAFLVVLAPLLWSLVLKIAPHFESMEQLVNFSRFAIATIVLLLALILSHKFLASGGRTLREIAPGVLLTFGLWVAAGVAFGSYIAEFARNYISTYAGLASVMIALVFLYMIAAIFIFGGELNAAILRSRQEKRPPPLFQWPY